MRSIRWTPIMGWLAATATSIVLASVAMTPVLRTAAPTDTALSSIDQLPAAQTSFPAPLPVITGSSGTPSNSPSPHKTHKSLTPTSPSVTSPATPSTDSPTTPPAGNPPSTTVEDGWTVTTGADGVRTYVRSYRVDGGQAVIKMTSDAVVSLVTATPADGYAVQKVQDSPNNLAVYFNKGTDSFIIHAVWWNDAPFVQVNKVGS